VSFSTSSRRRRGSHLARQLVAALKLDAIPGSIGWPVVILRPGPDPVESLAVALSRALNLAQSAPALAELIETFKKNEKTVHLIARQSLSENVPGIRLVILVDQFEGVFTLCPKDDSRDALIRNLLDAAKVVHSSVRHWLWQKQLVEPGEQPSGKYLPSARRSESPSLDLMPFPNPFRSYPPPNVALSPGAAGGTRFSCV